MEPTDPTALPVARSASDHIIHLPRVPGELGPKFLECHTALASNRALQCQTFIAHENQRGFGDHVNHIRDVVVKRFSGRDARARAVCEFDVLLHLDQKQKKSGRRVVPSPIGLYRDESNADALLLVMEYLDGENAYTTFVGPSVSEPYTVARYFHAMLEGLVFIHAAGVGYGDPTLHNFVIAQNATHVIAVDFNLALLLTQRAACGGSEAWDSIVRGGVRGKHQFFPAEMLVDAPYNIFSADAFTMGINLSWMLTGRSPLTGMPTVDLANADQRMQLHNEIQRRCHPDEVRNFFQQHAPASLQPQHGGRSVVDQFNAGLIDLACELLAPQPAQRLTAQAAAQRLEGLLRAFHERA